jgi:hypothetical protein
LAALCRSLVHRGSIPVKSAVAVCNATIDLPIRDWIECTAERLTAAEQLESRRCIVLGSLNRAQRAFRYAAISVRRGEAHFMLGEDLGDPCVVDRYVGKLGVDIEPLQFLSKSLKGSTAMLVSAERRLGS